MKKFAVIIFSIIVSIPLCSQVVDRMQEKKDSMNRVIKNELKINQAKADSLSEIFTWSSKNMSAIIANRSLSRDEKLNRIKEIAGQRDQKIEALLTADQIQKLKTIMSEYKQKMKEGEKDKIKTKG